MTSRSTASLVALGFFVSSISPALGDSPVLGDSVQEDRRAEAPSTTRSEPRSAAPIPNDSAAGELALSEAQRQRIVELREREARRVLGLQHALLATELELRRAELASPFDAERVNALIAQAAELSGFLRGTESRLVSDIAALLSEQQRRAFAEMRTTAPPEPRAVRLPAKGELRTEA